MLVPESRPSCPTTVSAVGSYAGALSALFALLALVPAPRTVPTGSAASDPPPAQDVPLPDAVELSDAVELEPLEDYEFMSCWGCHETITDEWARSVHALAWERPAYQAALADRRRPESCYGCHVPERLQSSDLERKPRPRSEDLEAFHFGISCRSCHEAEDGAMRGPIEDPVATDAHRSEFTRDFSERGSNALCIACHQTTVGPVIGIAQGFELAGQGQSCIECHMEPVERSMALDDDDRPTPVRKGRSHRLNGPRDPAFLARAFDVEAETRGEGVRVSIENAAGHEVPGLVDRSFTFTAELLDASGARVASGELRIDTQDPLPADGRRRLELQGSGVAVRLTGVHRCDALDGPQTFLATTVAL